MKSVMSETEMEKNRMSDFHKQKEKNRKNRVYTLTQAQIDAMKRDATQKAIDVSFILMLGLPVMVVHDHMPELWRKEIDGVGREERFADMILDLYDSFQQDYITLDDVLKVLNDECGLKILEKMDGRTKRK